MDHPSKNFMINNNLVIFSILFFFAFILFCSFTLNPSSLLIFNPFQKHHQLLTTPTSSSNSSLNNVTTLPRDELEEALRRASSSSMADNNNKTVIIAIVNKAYVEPHNNQYPTMFDLFLEGFWVGEETRLLLEKLVVVAMDGTAYERCKFRRLNCYRLATDGVDFEEEELYMSADFIKMMWARTLFLLDVLNRGYNFIFTDTDIIWLRNPFPKLNSINSTDDDDFQISTDKFNGDPRSQSNPINTGFYHIKSNNKTISLFQNWYDSRKNSTGLKEQDVLANLIRQGVINQLGLKVRFLDTLYFSGFCSDSRDPGEVLTVHANCCRSISAKIADLTAVLKDWNGFRRVPSAGNGTRNETGNGFQWSRHIACVRSWIEPARTTVP